LSNKLWALNKPPPNFELNPLEKNGSFSKELKPLLPNPEEEFCFYLRPKKPLKKSSSKGLSSKKCLNTSYA
jgi:hypothetical protein